MRLAYTTAEWMLKCSFCPHAGADVQNCRDGTVEHGNVSWQDIRLCKGCLGQARRFGKILMVGEEEGELGRALAGFHGHLLAFSGSTFIVVSASNWAAIKARLAA